MEASRVFLTLAWLLLMAAIQTKAAAFCAQEQPVDTDKTVPSIDFSYSTQVISRMLDSKSMGATTEAYDFDQQIMKTITEEKGNRSSYIVNYSTGKTIYSNNGYCYMTTRQIDLYASDIRGLAHLVNPGSKFVWKYYQTAIIRGVTLDHWRTCVTDSLGSFTIDYYFTMVDPVPFRAEIQGVLYFNGKANKNIHSIHDFFLFNKGSPKPADLVPAPGLICNGDNSTATPPLPMSAWYTSETTDLEKKTVFTQAVFFDKQYNISRVITSHKNTIRDFGRGLEFIINTTSRACTRKPFYRLGRLDRTLDSHGQIHMATLEHFFMDQGKFTYNGIHNARHIPCKVYTKRAMSAEMLGDSVEEIYVATGMINNVMNPVVRVVLKGGKPLRTRQQIEIYDFVTLSKSSGMQSFDLSSCFPSYRKINFVIDFKGKVTSSYGVGQDMRSMLPLQMSRALKGISLLRVSVKFATAANDNVIVYGTLYEKEYVLDLAQRHQERKLVYKDPNSVYVYHNASNTPTLCARYCKDYKTRPYTNNWYCSGFDFDRSDSSCTFNSLSSWKTKTVPSKKTDYYAFASKYNSEPTLSQAWSRLQTLVGDGKMFFTDSVGNVFEATSVEKSAWTKDKQKAAENVKDNVMNQFAYVNGTHYLPTPVETIKPMQTDACARHCLNALTYDCKGFQMTYNGMVCQLYDKWAGNRVFYGQETKTITKVLLRRNYFSNFEAIPGRSAIVASTDNVFTNLLGRDACAELCVKSQGFFCQSFEICGTTCILGRTHILNVPLANVKTNLNCTHFSRNYVQDYSKEVHQKVLTDTNVVEISNVGIRKCASMCSTSASYDCDAFEYCNVDSMCRISTKAVTKSHSLKYKTTGDCDFYSRREGLHRVIPVFSKETSSGSSSSGDHSPGSMGGIAIGMIILGIFLMVVLGMLLMKFKNPARGNDSGMTSFASRKMSEADC